MPNYIEYDPTHPVITNLVIRKVKSDGDIAKWEATPNSVRDPAGWTDDSGTFRWDSGTSTMVACSQGEIDALAAAAAANALAFKKQSLKNRLQDQNADIYYALHAIIDEIYAELDVHITPSKTLGQLKLAILNNAEARIDTLTE